MWRRPAGRRETLPPPDHRSSPTEVRRLRALLRDDARRLLRRASSIRAKAFGADDELSRASAKVLENLEFYETSLRDRGMLD